MVGRITLLDWALLSLGGMYGLGWIVVVLVTHHGGNPQWEDWINPFSALYPIHTLSAFSLVTGLIIGWYFPLRIRPVSPVSTLAEQKGCQAGLWALAFWAMLVIAILFQGIYTQAYGGYIGSLEFSRLIRSSRFEMVPDNPWSFLNPFSGLTMIAAYGFFGLWLSGRRRAGITLGLALSFVFSLYVLYSWKGRLGFLVFLATFVLGVLMVSRSNPLRLIFWGALIFVGILVSAYGVSHWLNIKAANSFPEFLAKELSFPFGSFFAQWDYGGHLFRGFTDFLVTPIYFLPSSWWMNWYEPVSQVNTALINGAPKGVGGVTGGIPVDLLTLGLMQAHLPGVVVVGGMFGLMLRLLQLLLNRIPLHGLQSVLEAHVALKIAVLGAFYSQPNLVVAGNFSLIAGSLIIFAILKLRKIRISSATHRPQTSAGGFS